VTAVVHFKVFPGGFPIIFGVSQIIFNTLEKLFKGYPTTSKAHFLLICVLPPNTVCIVPQYAGLLEKKLFGSVNTELIIRIHGAYHPADRDSGHPYVLAYVGAANAQGEGAHSYGGRPISPGHVAPM
jgi:hypothetical protein